MATRTISVAGGNYNSTSTWVEGIVPTAADDVVATASSGNLTVASGGGVGYCKSINLTGYVNTLNLAETLLVSGNITLGSGMTFTSTFYLNINANSSITSNGIAIPYLVFSANVTITLVDNLYISNTLYFQTGYNVTINGNNIYCTKNFILSGFSSVYGTTNIIMSGTGQYLGSTYGTIFNPFILNSPSGTITITGEMPIGNSLTYITGSIVMDTNTYLYIRGIIGTISVNFPTNKRWSYISANSQLTASILNSLSTLDLVLDRPFLSGSTINVYRDLYSLGSTGTTEIVIAGSGSWYGADSFYYIGNKLTFNTTGSFNFYGPYCIYYSQPAPGKITYISGNITFPTVSSVSSSFVVSNNTIFDTSGMTFNEITLGGVMTLSSSLNATTMSLGTNEVTFTGSAGFNTKILSVVSSSTIPRYINLTPGITYNVSEKFNSTGSAGVPITFRASSSAFRPYFNLALTGSQNVNYTNATNIDSSGGQMIYSLGGTLINSLNWSNYPSNFFLLFE
jgi:hypothetical protein